MTSSSFDEESYNSWSPTSPSSGVGTLDSRGYAYNSNSAFPTTTDENLPEVVPGTSPTLVDSSPANEKNYRVSRRDERHPKYPVVYDDAPKFANAVRLSMATSDRHQPDTPFTSVPWEPMSSIEDRPATSRAGWAGEEGEPRRMCGVRRRIIFGVVTAVLLVAVIVIAAVAGTAKARSNSDSPGASATPEPSSAFLNNSTADAGDGFQFQAFADASYKGNASTIITQEGFTDLGWQAHSYVWLPNNTGCCITFCHNLTTPVGWWCSQRYQQNASTWFERVYVGCGDNAAKSNSRCE